ncbi:hypothetical protein CGI80_10425, partial [Vibrio parahaemolyticus]
KDYINKNNYGQFYLNGNKFSGELYLKGSKSSLTLWEDEDFVSSYHSISDNFIHGKLFDMSSVTLVGLESLSTGRYSNAVNKYHEEYRYFMKAKPAYMIFGNRNIVPDEQEFDSVEFVVNDSTSLFFDHYAFTQIIHADKDLVNELLAADGLKSAELFDISRKDYRVGDYPIISVYTGSDCIYSFATPHGKFSMRHQPSYTMPSPSGYELENKVSCVIEFDGPKSFEQINSIIPSFIQLFQIIAGQKIELKELTLVKSDLNIVESERFSVYRCFDSILEEKDATDSLHPADRLIAIESDPKLFETVINNWLSRTSTWDEVRWQFLGSFTNSIYNTDRLVKTANMFDIIPDSAYPKKVKLGEELENAKRECKAILKKLPDSEEKNSLLGALGRMGTLTLKHKMRVRLELIPTNKYFTAQDMNLIIGQAVDCRNHFVHGSKKKFEYYENLEMVCFFIDTLDFLYGASELIEAGWDFEKWSKLNHLKHPFSRYLNGFDVNLSRLKDLVANK